MKPMNDKDLNEIFEKYLTKDQTEDFLQQIDEIDDQCMEDLSLAFDECPSEIEISKEDSDADDSLLDFIQRGELSSPVQSIEDYPIPDSQEPENEKEESTENEDVKSFAHNFTRRLLQTYDFKCWNDQVFVYYEDHGIYIHLSDHKLKILIRQGWDEKTQAKLTRNNILEIMERLKTEPSIQIDEGYFNCYTHLMNFWNGVLDLETGKLLDHSPKYRFTHCIRADYTAAPSGGETFMKFIDTAMQGNEQKKLHLQEIVGYMISEYYTAKKAPMLIGQPHSGKSTLNRVIGALIGSEHVANVPLHRLHERFILAHLSTKKVNICSEISDEALSNIEVFKAVTGNDELVAEYKGKDHFTYKSRIKLLFSGNSMPILKNRDVTSAFFDRLTFVNFNYTVPEAERDHNLENKLLDIDRSYIVAWAVEGIKRLVRNNFVFSESEESVAFKKRYIIEQNNTIDFIRSHCVFGPDCKVHLKPLYTEYLRYCSQNCFTAYSKDDFFAEIAKYKVQKRKFRLNGSKSLWGYVGIALKQEIQYKSA